MELFFLVFVVAAAVVLLFPYKTKSGGEKTTPLETSKSLGLNKNIYLQMSLQFQKYTHKQEEF